jgi:hypothetical protein
MSLTMVLRFELGGRKKRGDSRASDGNCFPLSSLDAEAILIERVDNGVYNAYARTPDNVGAAASEFMGQAVSFDLKTLGNDRRITRCQQHCDEC